MESLHRFIYDLTFQHKKTTNHAIDVTGEEGARGANAPQIFFLPENNLFGY